MMQAQSAWQALPGANCVSSEDESWLKQADFRFPDDSEEDDTHSVTARAYVQAVASIKAAGGGSRRRASIAQQQAPLLLELPQAAVLQQNAPPSKPTSAPAASRVTDPVGQKASHASVSATQQARDHPVPTNGHDLHTDAMPAIDAQHQNTMHALQMLFPQEVAMPAEPQSGAPKSHHPNFAHEGQLASPAHPKAAGAGPGSALAHSQLLDQQADALPADTAAAASQHDAAMSPAHEHQQASAVTDQGQPEPEQQEASCADDFGSPLEIRLSAEQISLLQAAYDNAQQYIEKDAAHTGPGEAAQSQGGTDAVSTVPEGIQLSNLQSIIVQAVRSLSPDSQSKAAQGLAQLAQASAATPDPANQALEVTLGTQMTAASGAPKAAATASEGQPRPAAAAKTLASGSNPAAASAAAAEPLLSKVATSLLQELNSGAVTPGAAAAQQAAPQTASKALTSGQPTAQTSASDTPAAPAAQPAIAAAVPGVAAVNKPASNAEPQHAAVSIPDCASQPMAPAAAATSDNKPVSTAEGPVSPAVVPALTAAGPASTAASQPTSQQPPALPLPPPKSTAAAAFTDLSSMLSASAGLPPSITPSAAASGPVGTLKPPTLSPPAASPILIRTPMPDVQESAAQQSSALPISLATLQRQYASSPLLSHNSNPSGSATLTPHMQGSGELVSRPASTPMSELWAHGNPLGLPYALTPEGTPGSALTPGTTPAAALSAPGSALPVSLANGLQTGGASPHLPVSLTPGGTSTESFPVMAQSQLPVSLGKQNQGSQFAVHKGFFSSHESSPALQQGHATQSEPQSKNTGKNARKKKRRREEALARSLQETALTPEINQPQAGKQHSASKGEGSAAKRHQSVSKGSGSSDKNTPTPGAPDRAATATLLQTLNSSAHTTPSSAHPSSKRQRTDLPDAKTPVPVLTPTEPRKPGNEPSGPSSKRLRTEANVTERQKPSSKASDPLLLAGPLADPSPLANPAPRVSASPKERHIAPEAFSPEHAAMKAAHDNKAYPLVGVHALVPQLRHVRSLMTSRHQAKYNLLDVINAIGWFAIGPDREVDYFLGDLHNSHFHQQQIHAVGLLFGVMTSLSLHPDRFHEKFRLTHLRKCNDSGILTHYGDMLMYFMIKLNELSKINGKRGDVFKREHRATLDLANAVGRKVQGSGHNSLNPGCVQRLQQLYDKGYLAVKRPKNEVWNPSKYPGWQGIPRYGPPSTTAQPPPKLQSLVSNGYLAVGGPSSNPPSHSSPQLQPAQPPAPPPAPVQAEPAATAVAASLPLPPPATLWAGSSATAAAVPTKQQAAATTAVGSKQATTASQSASMYATLNITHSFASPSAATSSWAANPGNSLPPPPPPPAAAMAPVSATGSGSVVDPKQTASIASSGLNTPSAVPPYTPASAAENQGQLADIVTALVTSVGPLFETFVAQMDVVVADPNVSTETMMGSITQNLAAAIAGAAMRLVAARRQ